MISQLLSFRPSSYVVLLSAFSETAHSVLKALVVLRPASTTTKKNKIQILKACSMAMLDQCVRYSNVRLLRATMHVHTAAAVPSSVESHLTGRTSRRCWSHDSLNVSRLSVSMLWPWGSLTETVVSASTHWNPCSRSSRCWSSS